MLLWRIEYNFSVSSPTYDYTTIHTWQNNFIFQKLTQLGGTGGAPVSSVTTQKEDPGFKPVFEGPF